MSECLHSVTLRMHSPEPLIALILVLILGEAISVLEVGEALSQSLGGRCTCVVSCTRIALRFMII